MTTGDYLVAHSTLPSGTALQHLLALQIGSGQGTVFCSQFSVHIEQQAHVVTRKAKRSAQAAPAEAAPRQIADKQQKSIAVLHRVSTMTVLADGPDELTVQQRTARSVVTCRPGSTAMACKRSAYTIESC